MRINYFSDVHCEFGMPEERPEGEILVLAGDFTVKANQEHFDWLNSLNFDHVIYVLGNHEFYRGGYMEKIKTQTLERIAPHVHFLDDSSVTINGVNFHGATLWTDYDNGDKSAMFAAENGMMDHRLIRYENGEKRFTAQAARYFHKQSVKFLEENVKEGDIVVTHHLPSYKSCHEMYTGSILNHAFASNLDDLIIKLHPKLWFHGHTHTPCDYYIDDTNILCNPRGYVGYEDTSRFFSWFKYVDI